MIKKKKIQIMHNNRNIVDNNMKKKNINKIIKMRTNRTKRIFGKEIRNG